MPNRTRALLRIYDNALLVTLAGGIVALLMKAVGL